MRTSFNELLVALSTAEDLSFILNICKFCLVCLCIKTSLIIVFLFGFAVQNCRSSVAKNTTARYEARAVEQVIETWNLALRTNASRRTKAKTKLRIMNDCRQHYCSLYLCFMMRKKWPAIGATKAFRFALMKI